MTHCWFDFEDGYYLDDDTRVPGHTCMLEDGHSGPHEPTSDDEIGVTFVGAGAMNGAESLSLPGPRWRVWCCRLQARVFVERPDACVKVPGHHRSCGWWPIGPPMSQDVVLDEERHQTTVRSLEIREYLDGAIRAWRGKRIQGSEIAEYYIDAFQSVRVSLLGELLPPNPGQVGEPG